jgi:hypothetical protein
MRIENFPEIIEVQDYFSGNYFTEHKNILSNTTYRELEPKSGYTLTIKNNNDYEELVKESNLFQFYHANEYLGAWSYYKAKLPIYIEGNFTDVLYEDKIKFEQEYGIKLVTGVVDRFYSGNYCNAGNVQLPYRLYIYEDYELGDYKNDY